jgi:hypothetical protein
MTQNARVAAASFANNLISLHKHNEIRTHINQICAVRPVAIAAIKWLELLSIPYISRLHKFLRPCQP